MNIKETLENANNDLMDLGYKVELIIVGGAAFIVKHMIDRATRDIDFINKVDERILTILGQYKINNRAKQHEINFGEWQKDKELIVEYSNIKAYTLSNERLLASRMFNRKRYEDLIESFKNKDVKIDQNKFEDIIDELIGYNDPPYKGEFKENIYLIDKLYEERGWNEKERIERICKRIT